MSTGARPIAVVTGGSTGIGEATARALATKGWRCVLVARRRELLERVAEEIDGVAEPCDLVDADAVVALGERLVAEHGSIGILANNAGALSRGTSVDVELDELERITRLNYLSGVWLTRSLLPGLRRAAADGGAHVVNVASIGGTIAFPAATAYSASKHAQVAFSRSLRAALCSTGVQVHTIMPGFVVTEGFPHPRFWETRVGRRFVVGPERVANGIVSAIENGKEEVVIPRFPYGLAPIAQALFPTLTTRVLALDSYRPDTTRPGGSTE
jgi:short-subunit dehydrogenase